MNRIFIKKRVTAGAFVVVLFAGAILNVRKTAGSIVSSVKEDVKEKQSVGTMIGNVETVIDENAFLKYGCIQTYGYLQRLMEKDEVNDFEVIRDQAGSLHLTYFGTGVKETEDLVDEVVEFQDSLRDKDTKVLYVMTPDKYLQGVTKMEAGLPYNYANETADVFLEELAAEGVAAFDYRDTILASGIAPEELFFKTDHHWTIETAFWAFRELANELTKNYGLTVPNLSKYTSLENYNVLTYKDSYLGSLGRKTGSMYSGVDDFSLLYPKFDTQYTFTGEINGRELMSQGKFDEALLNLSALRSTESMFNALTDRYSVYLYGHQAVTHITNEKQKEGPKILIVKDSFMVPVAAFLSTICSDVYLVDPRYYEGNISEYANSIEGLDYALISFTPQNLSEEFFRLNNKK